MQACIREAGLEDFSTLWRIDQECFAPGISYTRAELRYYMLQPGAFTLVAEGKDGAGGTGSSSAPEHGSAPGKKPQPILGFLVGQKQRRDLGHIVTIDVLSQARRAGVGSLLLSAAEERLRVAGCQSILLETAVDNETALKFYKRHRYFVMKTIPRYYMDKIDALLLGKRLR